MILAEARHHFFVLHLENASKSPLATNKNGFRAFSKIFAFC